MSLPGPGGQLTTDPEIAASGPWLTWSSRVSQLLTWMQQSGTTAQRPTAGLYIGRRYFDTTLGHPAWYDGTNWVNASGTTV